MKIYMFQTVRLSIIRSLFTVHSAVVYVIQVCRQLSSRTRMEMVLFCCWWVFTHQQQNNTSSILVLWVFTHQKQNETISILVPLESCLQTCMTCTIAE